MGLRGGPRRPLVGLGTTLVGCRQAAGYAPPMSGSPLDAHAASPQELRDRIVAERRGAPFLLYRTAAASRCCST